MENDLKKDQQFLRNLGYKTAHSIRCTKEPSGTVFDDIFRTKPAKPRFCSQKVYEQKARLEELLKAA